MPKRGVTGERRELAFPLRWHLLIFAFLIGVPAFAYSSYVLSRFASAEREQYNTRLLQTAADLADDIDRDIQAMMVTTQTLSTSRALRAGAIDEFYKQCEEAVAGTGLRVGLLTPDLQQVFTTLRPFGTLLPRPNDDATLSQAIQTKTPQVSDMAIGSVTATPAFNVVHPLIRDGQVQYLIRLGFDANRLANILQGQSLSPGWITEVTDRRQTIIARSQNQGAYLGKTAPNNSPQLAQNTPVIARTTNLDGVEILRAVVQIPTSGWTVAATVDLATVTAASSRAWRALALGGSILLLLSALFAALYARRVVQDLSRVAESAKLLGGSQLVEHTQSAVSEIDSISAALTTASLLHKQAEDRQAVLMREMQHRTQNILAVIHTIVNRTLASSTNLIDAREALDGRLQALSRTFSSLSSSQDDSVTLCEVIQAEMEAFTHRYSCSGPTVQLTPQAAQTFCLLVHELATNAAKYGALKSADGRVEIQWAATDEAPRRLDFKWCEKDGPPVKPPSRTGFGTTLTNTIVTHHFGGSVDARFEIEGLTYSLSAPLSSIEQGIATSTAGSGAAVGAP